MKIFGLSRAAAAIVVLTVATTAVAQEAPGGDAGAEDADFLDELMAEPAPPPAAPEAPQATAAASDEAAPAAADPGEELDVIPVAQKPQPVPAMAAAPSSRQVEEIVVTAAYREQSIQDVVGGAQVFGGEGLDKAGAKGMQDYLLEVPSVSLQKSGNGSSKISIRGISNVNASDLGYGAGSPTTGVYLNDVAIQGSGVFPDLNLFDLNRVEILKGPQGTLYGEGSMGGAIKMITMAPDMDEWVFRTAAMYSVTSDGAPSRDFRGAVNVPILEDRLAARIVGTMRHTGGYVDYTALDREDADSEDDRSLRAILSYKPWDAFELEYMYFYEKTDRDQFPTVDPGKQEALTNSRREDQYALTEFDIHALTVRWDLSFAQLTAVSAFYNTDRDSRRRTPVLQSLLQTQFGQLGLTAPDIFSNASTQVLTQLESFSQELRLVSAGDERFDWIGGLFYRDRSQGFDQEKREDVIPDDPTGLFNGILRGFNPIQGRQEQGFGDETFKQIAAYGEVNWELVPGKLELIGGLRAFREDVSFFIDTQFYGVEAFLLATDPRNIDPQTGTARKYFSQALRTQGILPKVSLSWHITDDHMAYATVARGFRSGTPNVYAALASGPPIVDPDYVWNKEIGLKSSWLDGTLIANLALYRIDWEDMQGTVVGTARLGIVPTDFAYLANAGDSKLLGAELGINWMPLEGLMLSLNLGYNDGEVTKPRENSHVVKGSALPNSPKLTWSSTLAYTWLLPMDLQGEFSATYSYIDKQSVIFRSEGVDDIVIDAYDQLKASIGISRQSWRLQLFGDNLTDKRAVVAISAPIAQYTVITPRVIGLRLSYDF
ncbi:TonB-dependent receptor [Solimonas sp. SE-A11]|uniref:TonB-dependent receptor n=1 Tax=Solimonas sp. SE-A11 TaxID=3054954 RepID=UPI00259D205C|nr:TonB-dependent receptor [Solimonas sp. SE-A11]MDM4769821.1 TonB-dependent receptor [Solimonas sp. SE-A11]